MRSSLGSEVHRGLTLFGPTLAAIFLGCSQTGGSTQPTGPSNRPPRVSQVSGPEATRPRTLTSFTCLASDPDGDPLTFTWNEAPEASAGASATFSWSDPGVHNLRCMASDGMSVGSSPVKVVEVLADPPDFVLEEKAIAAGQGHTCALDVSGKAFCWGRNWGGQLGNGTSVDAHTPRAVNLGDALVRLSAGRGVSCGLSDRGEAYCWGWNQYGQVGDGTNSDRLIPVRVGGDLTFKDIDVGWESTCALTPDGLAYCWGRNNTGQLGTGDTTNRLEPTAVVGGHIFAQVVVSDSHACALDDGGQAFCWGTNQFGELGSGSMTNTRSPVPVAGEHTFRQIAIGFAHGCGVKDTGRTLCWGRNFHYALGSGSTDHNLVSLEPIPVAEDHDFLEIDAGHFYRTCTLTAAGMAYCWGEGSYGALGDGGLDDNPGPEPVMGGHIFTTISAGNEHTCAVDDDRQLWCWGLNAAGALGDGTTEKRLEPIRVLALSPPS